MSDYCLPLSENQRVRSHPWISIRMAKITKMYLVTYFQYQFKFFRMIGSRSFLLFLFLSKMQNVQKMKFSKTHFTVKLLKLNVVAVISGESWTFQSYQGFEGAFFSPK